MSSEHLAATLEACSKRQRDRAVRNRSDAQHRRELEANAAGLRGGDRRADVVEARWHVLDDGRDEVAPVRGTIWVGLRPNIAEDAAQDVVAHLVDEDAGTHQNYDQDVDREAHDAVVLAALSDA